MDTAALQFHIIYTPGNVVALSRFVDSLLKWSDCSFQLVANGCDSKEQQHLDALSKRSERLSFRCLSTARMIEHSDALDVLQADCTDEWFCALDSDVFATGEFLLSLISMASTADVVTSCLPVWTIDSDRVLKRSFQRLQGTHVFLEGDLTIGCTYLLMYKNTLINQMRKDHNIGFSRYRFDQLDHQHRHAIQSLGAEKTDYDTGIVLNLLLLSQNRHIAYGDSPNLIHLGGLSRVSTGNVQFSRGFIDQASIRLKSTHISAAIMWLADLYYGFTNISENVSLAEYQSLASRARRRAGASKYFGAVMNALLNQRPPPEVPHLANNVVERRLTETTRILTDQFQSQGASLSQEN